MAHSVNKFFDFSEPFLKAEYIENAANLQIAQKTIVFNVDDAEIVIEGEPLGRWGSSIYSSVVIRRRARWSALRWIQIFFAQDASLLKYIDE